MMLSPGVHSSKKKPSNAPPSDQRLALYIHIPFCRRRCAYCAFNTYTSQAHQISPYIDALRREIRLIGKTPQQHIHTIYFGGGTPSLIATSDIAAILNTCTEVFSLATAAEITLEANPGTVTSQYLHQLHQAGVNRLSIGMQSAHAHELRLFARWHYLEDVHTTVTLARRAGFANLSLDLIYGIPHQTLEQWQQSLVAALRMAPNHLSLYSLGIEQGTPLQRRIARGELPSPDPDLAADMYEWASEHLAIEGFEHYEISNWAQPGFACQHNLHVWRNLPYLGVGAGAHGYAAHTRYANVAHPIHYCTRLQMQTTPCIFPPSAAAEHSEFIDQQTAMSETLLMGLRLTQEGISPDTFYTRFGCDIWSVFGPKLTYLIKHELLECHAGGTLRLTPRGRLLGNLVFAEFV